jgi:hypothetical protein
VLEAGAPIFSPLRHAGNRRSNLFTITPCREPVLRLESTADEIHPETWHC